MSLIIFGSTAVLKEVKNSKRKRLEDLHGTCCTCSTCDTYENNNLYKYKNKNLHSSELHENTYMAFRLHNNTSSSTKRTKRLHLSPDILVETCDRTGKKCVIRALCDSGTTSTLIFKDYVPRTAIHSHFKQERTRWDTMGGVFETDQKRLIRFKLPEFSTDKTVNWPVHVDTRNQSSPRQYDMLIGSDLMQALGIDIKYTTKVIQWENVEVPMKPRGFYTNPDMVQTIYDLVSQPLVISDAEKRHETILDADYSAVDIDAMVSTYDHLEKSEQTKLSDVLHRHGLLFQGGLGTCVNVRPIDLELIEGAKPYHARPYPVPRIHEVKTKKEIDRMVAIGVLKKDFNSPWAAATFIQPKKTGDIRVLTDFRRLNAVLKRKPFPLPQIGDLLLKLEGFTYATALDLSMGYYHIPMSEQAQALCTTVLPWGKYRYCRLPMGLKVATDVFQNTMMELLGDLPYVRVYLDDILITTCDSYEDHIEKMNTVLTRLEKSGFRANLRKCFFAKSELEYLGFWITRHGIQPQPKKVEAICRLLPPKNQRQLRRFLGMVNYYRDMWQRRSHILAPLTALTSKKVKWKWGTEEQQAFDECRRIISQETILAFPNFELPFHIYTDSSNYQLGATIIQADRPIAFYSRKMNSAQKRYPTGEQELLSIVETLKEFKNILLGQEVVVHTDHKNLLYEKSTSDRMIRWRLLVEEYAPTFVHIKGIHNVVADALSRLDADFDINLNNEPTTYEQTYAYATADDITEYEYPLSGKTIAKYQKLDKKLLSRSIGPNSNRYSIDKIENEDIIIYNGKICVPEALQARVVAWYHTYLRHPGELRTEETLRRTLVWPDMRKDVRAHCSTCRECQLAKKVRKKYGLLPLKEHYSLTPWERVDVDLIGPYTIRNDNGKTYTLLAMTMIDPATRWFEVIQIKDKTAQCAMSAFDNHWLCRYPRPLYIGFDNGGEFKNVFGQLCENFGLTPKPSTPHNPQSNAMIERIHMTLGNMLRSFDLEKQELNEENPFEEFLAAAAWALRSTYHTVLDATPGQLVYGRDMLLPIQFKANWGAIALRRKERIQRDNTRENKSRSSYQYTIGQQVLVTKPGKIPKMTLPREGPYTIVRINTNGTVRIQRGPIESTINIRRITPYNDRPNPGGE